MDYKSEIPESLDSGDDIISDFEYLVEIANDLSQQFEGISTKNQRKAIATQILAKAVPNCISLLKLIPESKFCLIEDNLDFASVASLIRNLIELANVHWYIAVEELSQEEQAFRLLLFNYHDSYSLKSIAQSLHLNKEDIEYLDNEMKDLIAEIEKNAFYLTLEKNSQKLILKGRKNSSMTQFQIVEKRGIDLDEFKGYYMLLSVHTHSSPTAIKQKVYERLNEQDGTMDRIFTLLLLNYSSKFLADLIRTTGNMWDLKIANIHSESIVIKYSDMLKEIKMKQ